MRYGRFIAIVILFVALAFAGARRLSTRPVAAGEAKASAYRLPVYDSGLTRLNRSLALLDSSLVTGDSVSIRRAFRTARAMYKRVELYAEYYGIADVRALNGVPLFKAEDEDPEHSLPPIGLQMVEGIVFPSLDTSRLGEARQLVVYMRQAVDAMRETGADTMPGHEYLFDAMKQQITRVATLGIAGFDASASGDAMAESAESLEGIREALVPFREELERRGPNPQRTLDARLTGAITYLREHPEFERFDRLTFISQHAVPTSHALLAVQQALGVPAPARPRAWSSHAASLYDAGAVDPHFYASTDAPRPDSALVSLGRDLFFDPVLSATGTQSCANCHVPERAFTDGRARAGLLPGHTAGPRTRNTPTLVNAGLQPTQFADNRARTLEDQAADVVGNVTEMGGTVLRAADAVGRRPEYRRRFASALGIAADSAVSGRTVRLAVAAYVRSLTAMNSPFDRAVKGETAALSAEAREGFTVFMGKGKCGTCHFAPLFNGALPPSLMENEPEVIGVPARRVAKRAVIDPDSGRFTIRRIDQHLHAFKTPTLRNVALTAPYMHNGVFPTLESVVDFYDGGGGAGIGATLAHQTLPADSLRLSAPQKRALVAFMEALTDTVGLTARPRR